MEYFTRHPAEAAGSVFEESYAASRAASPTGLLSWSTWEVADYLGQLGLSQHVDAFVEADIDGEALSYLDADLLQDLGVRSVGQRLRLLRAVYDLRVHEGSEFDGSEWSPPSAAMQGSVHSAYIWAHNDRLDTLEAEVAHYKQELDSLQVLVHMLGEQSAQVPPQPTRNERRKLSVTALSVDTSRSEQRPSVRDSMTPVGEHIRMLDTPLDSSAMPTGLVVSTPSSGALTPAPPNMDSLSSKRSKEVFRSPIEEEVLSSKAATPLLRPSLVNASRHARSTPDFRRNESESPAAYTKTERVRHTEGQDSTGTGRPAISRSESTTSGKRSGTQDTCFKVLPAAVKKYSLKHPWTEYAMIVTWAGQKRALSYDEKPRVVVHGLREVGEKPSCLVQHQNELKSPMALSAARRAKMFKSYVDEGGAENSSLPIQVLPTLMTEQTLSPEITSRLPPNAKYALVIFPYTAERDDEVNTEYSECVSILSRHDSWYEVAKANDEKPSKGKYRVPISTVIPIYTFPVNRNGAAHTLDTNLISAQFNTAFALVDRTPSGMGEVALIKGEKVRVYAKASFWSFLVNETDRTFGWAPSWHLGSYQASS